MDACIQVSFIKKICRVMLFFYDFNDKTENQALKADSIAKKE